MHPPCRQIGGASEPSASAAPGSCVWRPAGAGAAPPGDPVVAAPAAGADVHAGAGSERAAPQPQPTWLNLSSPEARSDTTTGPATMGGATAAGHGVGHLIQPATGLMADLSSLSSSLLTLSADEEDAPAGDSMHSPLPSAQPAPGPGAAARQPPHEQAAAGGAAVDTSSEKEEEEGEGQMRWGPWL